MLLTLIRHGQSHLNLGRWDDLENIDAGLTDLGQRQAAALRDWLRTQNTRADALYASTMQRARETAAYVREAVDLDITFDDRLRELANNYAGGLPVEPENLPRSFIEQWWHEAPFAPRTEQFANAESWMHMRIRLAQFIDVLSVQHSGQRVMVVAHGGVFDAMFDNVFNVGPFRRCETRTRNTAWSLFEHRSNPRQTPWMLHCHNRVDHLTDELLT